MTLKITQKANWLDSDLETVIGLFINRLGAGSQGDALLLESAAVDGRWGRYSLAAGDFLLTAACRRGRLSLTLNDERLRPLERLEGRPFFEGLAALTADLELEPEAPSLPPIARALYGCLGPSAAVAIPEQETPEPGIPEPGDEGLFVLPGTVYLFDHAYNQLVQLSLRPAPPAPPAEAEPRPDPPGPLRALWDREGYLKAAGAPREKPLLEVVLAARFSADFSGDLFPVYRRLRRSSPSAYMVFLRQGDFSLAVSSPEAVIGCEAGRLRLSPLAGAGLLAGSWPLTEAGSRGLEEDNLFEDEFISDPREIARHRALMEQGRAELELVAAPGSTQVERFMEGERFENLRRPTSRLAARAADGLGGADILKALFPAGALNGLPKAEARRLIASLEPAPRGLYGGVVGWLGLDKDKVNLDFGLTSPGLWARGGQAFWAIGAGLAPESDPAACWREIAARAEKVRGLLSPPEPAVPAAPSPLKFSVPDRPAASGTAASGAAASESRSLGEPEKGLPGLMENLAGHFNFSRHEAAHLFNRLMDGDLSPAQAGALLMGLKSKGETPVELAEAARAVLDRAVPLPPLPGPFIDVVGTGGDGRSSFNCSTATALTLAGLGYKVVKHGNRSVSSKSGSADALELLGEDLNRSPEKTPEILARRNFVFLFAPAYHPSFRNIMSVRKELGVRTLFNILGPLVNPARPAYNLLGVPNRALLPLVAEAQRLLGSSLLSAVVCGAGDYDELTALGPAHILLVRGEKITEMSLDPARYGFEPCQPRELTVSGPADGVEILRELLAGRGPAPMRDMLILNVALGIYVFRSAESFDVCLKEARRAVAGGAGGQVLS